MNETEEDERRGTAPCYREGWNISQFYLYNEERIIERLKYTGPKILIHLGAIGIRHNMTAV